MSLPKMTKALSSHVILHSDDVIRAGLVIPFLHLRRYFVVRLGHNVVQAHLFGVVTQGGEGINFGHTGGLVTSLRELRLFEVGEILSAARRDAGEPRRGLYR